MKNNCKLLLIALIAIVGFVSCKKEGKDSVSDAGTNVGTTVGSKTYLISKLIYSELNYQEIEYDAEGRVVKLTSYDDGEIESYSTIAYAGKKVTVTAFDADQEISQTILVTIGSNGYGEEAIITKTYKDDGYTYTEKSTIKLTQDGDGYVTKMTQTDEETSTEPSSTPKVETSSTDYIYANGNLQQTVETKSDNNIFIVDYEYDTDKGYNPFEDLREFAQFIGKRSKNLIKKQSQSHEGNTTHERNYTYTFNADELPITATIGDNDPVTIEYIVR